MKDKEKRKEQLIKELNKLRKRVAELEKSEAGHKPKKGSFQEREEALSAALNNLPDIVYELALDGKILYANQTASDIFGYSMEKLTTKNLSDFVEEDIWEERIRVICDRARSQEPSLASSHDVRAEDGNLVSIEARTILYEKEGQKPTLLGIARDVSERKRMEEVLRESEKRYRLLAENATDVIWTMSMDLKYTYISPSIESMRGLTPKEAMLQTLEDSLTPESFETIIRFIEEELNKVKIDPADLSRVRVFESELRHKNGGTVWGETTANFLTDLKGNPTGILGVTRDITKRKKMEQELLKARNLESISVLAGGIAHDFNNILMVIIGNLNLAQMKVQPGDELNELLGEAETAAWRASGLTKQLLAFARGGAPIRKTAYIAEMIRDTVVFVLGGSNVRCEFSIDDCLWPVDIDKEQISQVIKNLIVNAEQAMPEGGVIKVLAENVAEGMEHMVPLKEGRYVKISIADQGVGIPEEHFEKIYDPYFTTKHKGSGLGLATSYSVLKSHDGYISVESELGEGTAFHLYLPASDVKIPDVEYENEKLIKGRGKILLMDDEESLRNAVKEMLGLIGYEVDLAEDGVSAIELYKKALADENPYDAVILDLTVPGGMGGKKTIERLLEIDPRVKAILSSGYSNDPVMADFEKYGFKGVLAKPCGIERLSEVINKVIME